MTSPPAFHLFLPSLQFHLWDAPLVKYQPSFENLMYKTWYFCSFSPLSPTSKPYISSVSSAGHRSNLFLTHPSSSSPSLQSPAPLLTGYPPCPRSAAPSVSFHPRSLSSFIDICQPDIIIYLLCSSRINTFFWSYQGFVCVCVCVCVCDL